MLFDIETGGTPWSAGAKRSGDPALGGAERRGSACAGDGPKGGVDDPALPPHSKEWVGAGEAKVFSGCFLDTMDCGGKAQRRPRLGESDGVRRALMPVRKAVSTLPLCHRTPRSGPVQGRPKGFLDTMEWAGAGEAICA